MSRNFPLMGDNIEKFSAGKLEILSVLAGEMKVVGERITFKT
jgi:hypothetical protein